MDARSVAVEAPKGKPPSGKRKRVNAKGDDPEGAAPEPEVNEFERQVRSLRAGGAGGPRQTLACKALGQLAHVPYPCMPHAL